MKIFLNNIDGNQIIRGVISAAAHSKEFHRLLEDHE
jgi:hypothetical protein